MSMCFLLWLVWMGFRRNVSPWLPWYNVTVSYRTSLSSESRSWSEVASTAAFDSAINLASVNDRGAACYFICFQYTGFCSNLMSCLSDLLRSHSQPILVHRTCNRFLHEPDPQEEVWKNLWRSGNIPYGASTPGKGCFRLEIPLWLSPRLFVSCPKGMHFQHFDFYLHQGFSGK